MSLSVIIPAFQEADRIGDTLTAIVGYLDSQPHLESEIIVVDDGSTDGTSGVARDVLGQQGQIVRHQFNRGKGAAVRTGVMISSCSRVIYADADSAVPFEFESQLRERIDAGVDIAVGSRCYLSRNRKRRFASRVFSILTQAITGLEFADTQCGFKMLEGDVARALFCEQHENGYLFDVELLLAATKLGYAIDSVHVDYLDVAGSKVNLIPDSLSMLLRLLVLRRRFGRCDSWRIVLARREVRSIAS